MFFLSTAPSMGCWPWDLGRNLQQDLLSHHPALALVSLQADLNTNMEDEGSSFYGVSSQYESPANMIITCSTKVCSFGKQVVEKVEVGTLPTWAPAPHAHAHTSPTPAWASHLFPQICLS